MVLADISSPEQVTDEQASYLAGLAQTLSGKTDFEIQNFADSVVTSPDAQKALQSEAAARLLKDEVPPDAAFDIFNPGGGDAEVLALSRWQENSIFDGLWPKIKLLFGGLRRKVKRIFCNVVNAWGKDKDLDLKKIIKEVLIALVPVLGASAGLMPVALPIVVSLAAMFIKYGAEKVCPV